MKSRHNSREQQPRPLSHIGVKMEDASKTQIHKAAHIASLSLSLSLSRSFSWLLLLQFLQASPTIILMTTLYYFLSLLPLLLSTTATSAFICSGISISTLFLFFLNNQYHSKYVTYINKQENKKESFLMDGVLIL